MHDALPLPEHRWGASPSIRRTTLGPALKDDPFTATGRIDRSSIFSPVRTSTAMATSCRLVLYRVAGTMISSVWLPACPSKTCAAAGELANAAGTAVRLCALPICLGFPIHPPSSPRLPGTTELSSRISIKRFYYFRIDCSRELCWSSCFIRVQKPARSADRRKSEDLAQRSDDFLVITQSLLVKLGSGRITLNLSPREAGVSKQTAYAKYRGKPNIMQAVMQPMSDQALIANLAADDDLLSL